MTNFSENYTFLPTKSEQSNFITSEHTQILDPNLIVQIQTFYSKDVFSNITTQAKQSAEISASIQIKYNLNSPTPIKQQRNDTKNIKNDPSVGRYSKFSSPRSF